MGLKSVFFFYHQIIHFLETLQISPLCACQQLHHFLSPSLIPSLPLTAITPGVLQGV